MARPSIVPIALTIDDRTGYTLWAPPWEEDGEEWQAFLGTTEDDDGGSTAKVHLFPTPATLAAFCRSSTDHDLADHPVWPVVAGLDAAELTPDDEHRYDLDAVYEIAAENPDRWAVEELAAAIDIVTRLADCLDTGDDDGDDTDDEGSGDEESDSQFEALAELVARPEIGSLGLGVEAFVGRAGEDAWVAIGGALDDLWEDVLEELSEHLDWTGAGTVSLAEYPTTEDEEDEEDEDAEVAEDLEVEDLSPADDDADDEADLVDDAAPAPGSRPQPTTPGVSAISGGGRISAHPAAVAAAAEFWESVGILPVEIVVPEGAGLTLRCYVDDQARFLGRDGEIFAFSGPLELARFCSGHEAHDLTQIATWPEVADTDTLPLPADQDRYDLAEVSEVLGEVADGAAGLVDHRIFAQPVEGVRDIAEYVKLPRVDELLSPSAPLGRAVSRGEREPEATLRAEDAAVIRRDWDDVVSAVSSALVFRD